MFKKIIPMAVMAFMTFTPTIAQTKKTLEVAVIIKATDSEFWQSMVIGAENYGKTHPDVKVTVHGPASESEVDKQVAILENVIATKPAGILIASSSSDATVPAINKAIAAGIPVVTADNKVKTKVTAHLATNNRAGGALAAEKLVEAIKAKGKPLEGQVGLISAIAGNEVLISRDGGFTQRLSQIAPKLKVLPIRYVDSDIQKAMAAANDLMLANAGLVGFFADNNHTGIGVATAIRDAGRKGHVNAVAFDSDPEEVSSLKDGTLAALVVQDPYGMGFKGVEYVLQAVNKKVLPEYTDTGAYAVTKANMEDAKMKALLNPRLLKK